jgi:RimJ/RimL family protein N-acetyltransferase
VEYDRAVRAGRELDRDAAIEFALRAGHVNLETERLIMRRYTQDDAAFVFDMYSRWEVQQFLAPNSKPMGTMDEAVETIERWRGVAANTPLLGVWAVTTRDDGRPVGTVAFKMAPLAWGTEPLPLSDDYEIVWHLHPEYWGRGYATEASAALLKRAFAAGVPEVIAIIREQNEPSKRVARRLGMKYVGESDRYYSMTAELWRVNAKA